jgi:hypothetical protein
MVKEATCATREIDSMLGHAPFHLRLTIYYLPLSPFTCHPCVDQRTSLQTSFKISSFAFLTKSMMAEGALGVCKIGITDVGGPITVWDTNDGKIEKLVPVDKAGVDNIW